MVLGTGRPSSSVMVPATMMRSPIAALPVVLTVRSTEAGNRVGEKLGPVVSVMVCGSFCRRCSGCRLRVLPYSGVS